MKTRHFLFLVLVMALTVLGCGQGSSTSTASGPTSVNMVFLQAEGAAEIYGVVFDDANGNGVMDTGEAGIPDVTVTLQGNGSVLTDADGMYAFGITVLGSYEVIETDPPGYSSTTPNTVAIDVSVEGQYRVDFADMLAPVVTYPVTGTVFSDLNQNGIMDSGEEALPDVTVALDGSESVLTNGAGQYAFAPTTLGAHSVGVTLPAGSIATTPNPVAFDLTEDGAVVDFGLYLQVEVVVDVKPGSHKNPVNLGSNGVTPVAILGSESFDVRTIDPSSLLLEGVAPLRWSYEDVAGVCAQPMGYDGDDIGDMDDEVCQDGYEDMTLKFDTPELAEAIGQVMRGDVVTLHLEGALMDGTPITGVETIYIVKAR